MCDTSATEVTALETISIEEVLYVPEVCRSQHHLVTVAPRAGHRRAEGDRGGGLLAANHVECVGATVPVLLLVELPGVGPAGAKRPINLEISFWSTKSDPNYYCHEQFHVKIQSRNHTYISVTKLLHHLEEKAGEVASGLVAGIDRVGVALKQGVSVVDDLIVWVPVQGGHNVGHLRAVQLGEEEHLESGDPQLG